MSDDKPTKKVKLRGDNTKFEKKNLSPSTQRYLKRQSKDPFVQEARDAGYRSRAVFKLLEINDKYGLLKSGQLVVDLGAAPGGWSQLAAEKGAKVVAVDLLEMEPIAGVESVQADFSEDEGLALVEQSTRGKKVDVVLSDMAPNTSGHAATDALRNWPLPMRRSASW